MKPAGYGKQGNDLPVLRRLINADHARQMNSALLPYLMHFRGASDKGRTEEAEAANLSIYGDLEEAQMGLDVHKYSLV